MIYDRQCPSCGGFCGRGGCKVENVSMNKQREALLKAYDALAHIYKFSHMAIDAVDESEALAERELLFDDHASSQACHVAWKQCANTIDKFDGDPHGAFTMGFHAGIQAAVNAKHPPAKPAAYLDLSNNISYSMRELSNEDAYDTDAMVPLYLSPQNRKPLTDEQIDMILQPSPIQAAYDDLMALARAIERAHGIGGE